MKRLRSQASLAIALLVSSVLMIDALPTAGEASPAPKAHAASPVAPSVAPQSGDPVPDQYVVVFKDDFAGDVAGAAEELVRANGGTLLHVYQDALKGFSARFDGGSLGKMESDERVESIEQDRVISINASRKQLNPPSWGIDRIDQRDLPLNASYIYEAAGAGVNIYVIDTGIRITHLDFDGRASYGYDFVDNDEIADDGHGHGTHVSGTAAGKNFGVAKSAKLIAVRVLNDGGFGTFEGVIAGVDWVTGQRLSNPTVPAVANMSLGAAGFSFPPLENAIRTSIAFGVTYAIAAGNSFGNDACTNTPANVTEALTVGATNINDVRADFSDTGPCLDLFAPGEAINSTWNFNDSATAILSGTSMATPHVAGVAALYLGRHPSASPAEVADVVTNNATPNHVIDAGFGSPNLLLFSRFMPVRTSFDFNADGTADESVARPFNKTNYLWYAPTLAETSWGNLTDVLVPADYDGDAKTDVAVWRPSDGIWYIIPSTTGVAIYPHWGTNGDIPVPADYDGDFRDDLAVFRPSEGRWYILNSNNGQITYRYWGLSGDRPVPADYDGDGLADAAVIRPNTNHTWYILNSSNGVPSYVQWGLDTDIDVPGDYDGDGKADQAVRRTSDNIWYVRLSTTGQASYYNWGLSSDIAVPADYDGDGRTDIAVWRPSDGIWYIVRSSTGLPDYRYFGLNGDVPLPTATPRG
jgi:subtilisin family serine protease